MPTVEQIRRVLPYRAVLAAGTPGIYNEVSWVVVLKPTPPAFDRLRGKELALVDMATARGLGMTLSFLVNSLAEQGVSAIGVLGEILPADKENADRHRVPLLQLAPESDLNSIEGQITTIIRDEREQLYQLEQELTKELMSLTLAGKSADAILKKLQEITGRTFILLGMDYGPLPSSSVLKHPELRQTLLRQLPVPPVSIAPVQLSSGLCGFLSPITGKQGNEGYLLVTAPEGDLKEADRVTSRVGALSLAIVISRQQAVEDVEDKFQVEMVESLLNGDLPAAAVNERAGKLGLDFSQDYAAIAVLVSGSNLRGPAIARKAESLFKKALCHYRADLLIIFYPVAADPASNDLRDIAHEISRTLTSNLGAAVTLGMGRAYHGAAGLRLSFQEAERALAIGKKLFGEGSTNFFSDLGVYRLLLSLGTEDLKSFYQDSIGRLTEYEKQREGELVPTLEAILRYPTLADTAKALHVHRNTLLYRIQRIQEIAKVDLDDGETRLILHLALRAGEVIRVS